MNTEDIRIGFATGSFPRFFLEKRDLYPDLPVKTSNDVEVPNDVEVSNNVAVSNIVAVSNNVAVPNNAAASNKRHSYFKSGSYVMSTLILALVACLVFTSFVKSSTETVRHDVEKRSIITRPGEYHLAKYIARAFIDFRASVKADLFDPNWVKATCNDLKNKISAMDELLIKGTKENEPQIINGEEIHFEGYDSIMEELPLGFGVSEYTKEYLDKASRIFSQGSQYGSREKFDKYFSVLVKQHEEYCTSEGNSMKAYIEATPTSKMIDHDSAKILVCAEHIVSNSVWDACPIARINSEERYLRRRFIEAREFWVSSITGKREGLDSFCDHLFSEKTPLAWESLKQYHDYRSILMHVEKKVSWFPRILTSADCSYV